MRQGRCATPKSDDGKAWHENTIAKVDHVKSRAEQVQQALRDLEVKEQERIAIQAAERERQKEREEAAERKRKRDAFLRAEEERKRLLAEEMGHHQAILAKSKADERCALKAATAKFLQKTEQDAKAREMKITMRSMDNAVEQVGLTASQCMHEGRMKFSALKVCEMRLSMRETRPQSEAFRDPVDEALEKEHLALTQAREELRQCAEQGEQVRTEIAEVQSLLITGNSRDNVKNRLTKSSSLPALAASAGCAPSQDQLLARGRSLVEKALELDEKGNAALERTKENCGQAAGGTATCFQQRSFQTGELKSRLQIHKKQATATIKQAEHRLQMLKMRSYKTPETPRSSEATAEQMRQVEELIRELREGKRNLEEDYRLKTSSFKVDRSCINLTKIKAGSHVGSKTKITVE